MRFNKFLARSGVTSRRKAEELIISGKVKINGQTVTDLATEVDPQKDKVEINQKIIELPDLKYFLFNKPKGYTVTKEDQHAEHTIFEILPNDPSLISVGRLDRDTEGLLLITNDGDFAQKIIHPSNKIEKEYEAVLEKNIEQKDLDMLEVGVTLEDGTAKAIKTAKLSQNKASIVIIEGRKRQVRRMFEAIENKVIELKRVRIGKLKLDVEPGHYREMTPKEVEQYA